MSTTDGEGREEWIHDTTIVFDSSVHMGEGFDWFGWENLRQEYTAPDGQRFVVWKDLRLGKSWSAYGGNDGSLALWAFETEQEAKDAVIKWCEVE